MSRLTPAHWLRGPVSCILAVYLSVAIQNIVLIAAILNFFLVTVWSHHSKRDEAIWYAFWNGAAHLWDNQKQVKEVRTERKIYQRH